VGLVHILIKYFNSVFAASGWLERSSIRVIASLREMLATVIARHTTGSRVNGAIKLRILSSFSDSCSALFNER
jgi:glycerol kinase